MALLFRDKVFTMLIKEEKISEALAQKISSWPNSGFNIQNEVEIAADDEKGKENLSQYIIKAPISQERMIYDKEKQRVIYNYNSKRGRVIYDPLELLRHISLDGGNLQFTALKGSGLQDADSGQKRMK